ncbi:MAG: hypothetical protein PHC28_07830 [Flavobacterium sp.]|uniref:hypothetical protein n=1 Tax=Flavobacterium sp. TaxID=239 RepID=UPI002625A8EB|nr:hypothetical protein [Flavobacterium sp.]MDD5150381.1 hypothetical protein [Flavobacterium sp.]
MSYDLFDLAKDALTNNIEYADQEQTNNRKEICNRCEFLQTSVFDKLGICGKCGCMMNKKIQFKRSSCIIGKW